MATETLFVVTLPFDPYDDVHPFDALAKKHLSDLYVREPADERFGAFWMAEGLLLRMARDGLCCDFNNGDSGILSFSAGVRNGSPAEVLAYLRPFFVDVLQSRPSRQIVVFYEVEGGDLEAVTIGHGVPDVRHVLPTRWRTS